jgi:hypothetical protein
VAGSYERFELFQTRGVRSASGKPSEFFADKKHGGQAAAFAKARRGGHACGQLKSQPEDRAGETVIPPWATGLASNHSTLLRGHSSYVGRPVVFGGEAVDSGGTSGRRPSSPLQSLNRPLNRPGGAWWLVHGLDGAAVRTTSTPSTSRATLKEAP